MDWGFANRLSKVLKSDGRCFYLAMDHGYFQGPTTGLEKPGTVAALLSPYVDALFLTRGTLRAVVKPGLETAIILRASGGTSMVGKDLANEDVSISVDDILRLNASAVGVSVFIGSDYERQTLANLTSLVNACTPYGVPVMAVTAVGRELDQKKQSRFLALACRICAELGASVVKTYYCDEFEKVAQSCPVPVVLAGGPKTDSEREVLEFVWDGLERGAVGVNLGRNIWQNPHPVAMARALRAVIHEKAKPKEAHDLYLSLKREAS